MSKYLYGASVQGIQEFIFKTNKLKEIVGASEIVKSIAELFEKNFKADEILINAAGNIKVVFESEEECKRAVLDFPKMVMQKAYGISLSQAVVAVADKYTQDDINELESRLKTQRNKPTIPLDSSINIMQLAPSTAKPTVKYIKIQNKETAIDKATLKKYDAYEKFLKENPRNKEFSDISNFSNVKNKIAVIHIDGNGLGQIVPKLGNRLSSFSEKLNKATEDAFTQARDESMSIRDVILGGDDITVICNANEALEFTRRFLQNFEDKTEKIEELKAINTKKLTACAGIAYCNEKYPFHYAVSLAEALCTATKKHAKAINADAAPSSLMFHNIQSSHFQSWKKFIADELTINNGTREIRCDFGPYYISEAKQPLIEKLQISTEAYRCDGSPIGRLRNWMSELYKNDENAENLLKRINEVTEQSGKWRCEIMDKNLENLYANLSNGNLILTKDGFERTPIYDILQILSVTDPKGAN